MDLYHASQCGVPSVGTWDVSKVLLHVQQAFQSFGAWAKLVGCPTQARSSPPIIAYVNGPQTVLTVRVRKWLLLHWVETKLGC
jgi:hypothetical protein